MARHISDAISDMEDEIARVAGLSRAVAIMGDRASSQDVDADAVSAIGRSLGDAVDRLKAAWSEAYRLAPPIEVGPNG